METHLGHRGIKIQKGSKSSNRYTRGRGVPSSKQRRLENSYPLVAGRITLIYRQEAGGKSYEVVRNSSNETAGKGTHTQRQENPNTTAGGRGTFHRGRWQENYYTEAEVE